ncbi:MAG: hypothetical protein A3G49_02095 [Candidatus Sungbacteria bacterium RIFCSPLOWO2_12_FULL_41_11]|uniref:Uncharacterized protein n=1 Tax=Candidatus Sungbacteria bacterium RIFCSPLOWO2_12_FULL_41_11 TaxID=1802286 RepID=A0A1G2LRX1_9BACT|nr:MAG: hypothetical protein UV01_C0007G0033 [Parcubacteria group bacterium GW2011_GWA2_42_14]OHA00110.1 MAG: hypothetical protein A3D41_00560 [Candidatus Sungbacteria bacterium RIFCSPHIGHO2_02_FULL_41_12b]OHA14395.1 MAG: hypothetical protein A3G49_02095 [Candidatus Sungbacteria bacterium RIFCSPLOWO2_12_FULL_41_11]
MAKHEEISLFFGISPSLVELNEILKVDNDLILFDQSGIEEILPDRPPFLILKKAAVFTNKNGNKSIVSLSEITREDCAGHIPEELMTPLILFSKALALTGRFLAAFLNGGNNVVAEVIKTGPVESLLGFSDLRYTRPPVNALSYAEVISVKGRRVIKATMNTQTWIVAGDHFVPAGKISGLEYAIIPKQLLLAALRQ